jgi:ABC-2 type transport system ATP-binding protein
MEEAQRLADRVVVLAKGRIVAEGTPDELGSGDPTSIVSFREPAYHETLPLPECASVERGLVSFRTTTPTRDLAPLLAWAAGRGMELEHLTVTRPTLEDVYLDLTATEEVAA